MPKKRVKPPHLELTVVLDTNTLFTGLAHFFLRKEVGELIEQHSQHPDLTVHWIVPEVVCHEREFQMFDQALLLLPHVEKVERLLGHNLNIKLRTFSRPEFTMLSSRK